MRQKSLPDPKRGRDGYDRWKRQFDIEVGIRWDPKWLGAETETARATLRRHLSNLEINGYLTRESTYEGGRLDRVKLLQPGIDAAMEEGADHEC